MNTLRRWITLMTHHPWRRLAVIVGFSALLVLALGVAALTGVRTASANTNGCPHTDPTKWQTSNLVGASFSIKTVTNPNDTATYVFDSFGNQSPSGGIPGLIEYCVYPSPFTTPDSTTVAAVGANGAAWTEPPSFDNFSFSRPDGDPSNIELNGTTGITMGTATWNTGAPATQTIVLHINDAAECDKLYGGNPGTCFVLPGSPQQQAKDLTVSKTATPSFDRTFTWGITKSVDKTKVTDSSGSHTFNYTVSVTHDSGTDGNWQVTGKITVSNPNGSDFTGVNVTDDGVTNGGSCSVSNGTGLTVPANGSIDVSYKCTYSSAPSPSNGTNKATATWDGTKYNTPDSTASNSADFDFAKVSPTLVDDCVDVTDTLGGSLGKVCSTDPSPTTLTYSYKVSGTPGTCVTKDNTAMFTTNTNGVTGSASQSVTLCTPADLQVAKDATPSFTRTYNWKIAKSVDKTLLDAGGTATYTVTVTETGFTDSAWQVTGTITVTNPNDFESITLTDVKDAVDNGGSCTVSGSTTGTIAAKGTATLSYSCAYSSAPTANNGTNTATASWDQNAASTPDGSAQGTKTFAFTTPTKTVNQTITVTDTIGGNLGSATATDPPASLTSKTFTYTHKFTPPASGCVTVNNTATIVETNQTASASVKNCNTGALTMGFWQNTNGQKIISGGSSTSGVCNSGTWLRQYAPFQDLSATAPCGSVGSTSSSNVVGYVYNVIKAAACTSTSNTCNSLLKAQMLATALDVYFSDPALGGNKIGAPGPIGAVTIDLTKICTDIPTCTTFVNVSSAFGNATSMTVSQMLAYAASQSNVGGTTWYGQVKATQVLAKDAFDAINNQVAFSP